jgi:hypothetical protein
MFKLSSSGKNSKEACKADKLIGVASHIYQAFTFPAFQSVPTEDVNWVATVSTIFTV